jgi:tetratricopeptide (TPR) repeat protein
MLFLFLAGVILEMGCGRLLSGASYLVTGLGAVGLYWLVHRHSLTPLVGASGAIAGLMGALTALYGRKRIKMFVYTGFYFHYHRVPAIWLLPPWVGLELYRLTFNEGSNVAYVAHLGGLLTGAAIGYVMSRLMKDRAMESLTPEPADTVTPLIDQALEKIRELELDAGAELLEQVLAQQPDHVAAMTHLFNLRKNEPRSTAFHDITASLLKRLTRNAGDYDQAQRIYEDYLAVAKPPRLAPDLYLQMSVILAGLGQPAKAERIIALFLKQKPNHPGIPSALLSLAQEYRQGKNTRKYQTCLKLLQTRYPASAEGQMAADQIKHQGTG